jgi:WD40 repeat protein
VLEGHAGLGILIKFNHAGDFLISTAWDGTTRLWDPVSGRQLVQGEGHFVDIRRDDRQLALIRARKDTCDLGLWEVAPGWECRTLHHGSVGNRTPRPEHWGPTAIDFAPDGRLLASSHLDGVRLWDLDHFTEAGYLPVPSTAQVRFHAKGDSLFTYGQSGLSRWPIRTATAAAARETDRDVLQIGLPQAFDVPGNWVHPYFDCDPLGRRLIAVDYPRSRAYLFDLKEPGKKLELGQPGLTCCALCPDGRWALTWSPAAPGKSSMSVWDAAEGNIVWRSPPGESMGYFTPDGRWLVTSPPGDTPMRLWEVGSWQPGGTLPRPSANRLALGPSPDGMVLVSMDPGPPRLFHAATAKELATLEAPRNYGGAGGARFSPDGTQLAVATGNHTIHVWDLRAIRRRLTELDLDWDLPSYPPPVAQDNAEPLRVEVSSEVVESLKERP